MKLTVSEYAKEFKTSVQSVYQRIKRGTLKSVEENGIKYVLMDEENMKDDLNPELKSLLKRALKTIDYLQEENSSMRKEIKRLTKRLEKAQSGESQVLREAFHELKAMKLISAPVPETKTEEVIDLEEVSSEKDNKKGTKKAHKKQKKGKKKKS